MNWNQYNSHQPLDTVSTIRYCLHRNITVYTVTKKRYGVDRYVEDKFYHWTHW